MCTSVSVISEDGYFVQDVKDEKDKPNRIKISDEKFAILKSQGYIGKKVVMASRPEYVYLDDAHLANYKECTFDLDVDLVEMLGSYYLVHGNFGGETIIAKVDVRNHVKSNTVVKACFDNNKLHFFDVDSTRRIRAEEKVSKEVE